MFTGPLTESILQRAQDAGLLSVKLHDIRAFATDRHKSVDDYPFGGGAGMVMRADVIYGALAAILAPFPCERVDVASQETSTGARPPVIYLSPDGEVFNQRLAHELAALPRMVLVC